MEKADKMLVSGKPVSHALKTFYYMLDYGSSFTSYVFFLAPYTRDVT